MICPACEQEGKTSKVFSDGTSSTLVGYFDFYDEAGKHHDHDDNCNISYYHCSNGHRFQNRPQNTCWCGWKGKTECFCSPLGAKIL